MEQALEETHTHSITNMPNHRLGSGDIRITNVCILYEPYVYKLFVLALLPVLVPTFLLCSP